MSRYDPSDFLGPRGRPPIPQEEIDAMMDGIVNEAQRQLNQARNPMHYRNGREAKNGDKVVMIGGYGGGGEVIAVGVLYDAKPGNDHCNGNIAPIQNATAMACLCDCLHVDDLAALLKKEGLDHRPAGK